MENLSRISLCDLMQPMLHLGCQANGLSWTILSHFKPLEEIIQADLIPVTGCPPPNDCEQDLLALPARLSGIVLMNPTSISDEFKASLKVINLKSETGTRHTYEVMAEKISEIFLWTYREEWLCK